MTMRPPVREDRGSPRVSVVIPHYQDLFALNLCLSSLERQTYDRDDFEIIVADNNSPAGEAAVAEVVKGRARLVVCRERGAGPARNAGVAISRGEILAFIDSDCQADAGWLANGVPALERFDFIGGQVRVLVDDPERMTGAEAFEAVFAFDFETYINKRGFTGAGNMLCPRTLFDTVGGFLTGVSEDIEWSRRARATGFSLGYVKEAIIGHPARRNWDELRTKWERVNMEFFALHVKSGRGKLSWIAKCLALPPSALVHTPKVLFSDRLTRPRDKVLALLTLYRSRFWRGLDGLKLAASGGVR
jgi:glycosyltransferase involved in cell wall biosynthesis